MNNQEYYDYQPHGTSSAENEPNNLLGEIKEIFEPIFCFGAENSLFQCYFDEICIIFGVNLAS